MLHFIDFSIVKNIYNFEFPVAQCIGDYLICNTLNSNRKQISSKYIPYRILIVEFKTIYLFALYKLEEISAELFKV